MLARAVIPTTLCEQGKPVFGFKFEFEKYKTLIKVKGSSSAVSNWADAIPSCRVVFYDISITLATLSASNLAAAAVPAAALIDHMLSFVGQRGCFSGFACRAALLIRTPT